MKQLSPPPDVPGAESAPAYVRYDPSTARRFSITLVLAVATLREVTALDLTPLAYSVDPDALDAFVGDDESEGAGGQMTFEFGGYHVTVEACGLAKLVPLEDDPGPDGGVNEPADAEDGTNA